MADNPDAAPDNVVPLYSKALLPHRIPAGRFADAMRELRDNLRGSLREDGVVARIAHIFERLMWVIAKGDDLQETVFPTATELALALDELDDEIAALKERPTTSADPERVAVLERELAEVRSALEVLRTQHEVLAAQQRDTTAAFESERTGRAADRTAHDERVAALTRELDGERTARTAAERMRDALLPSVVAAIREGYVSADLAITSLRTLLARTEAIHRDLSALPAISAAIAVPPAVQSLTDEREALDARREHFEQWIRQVTEGNATALSEIEELEEEDQPLAAKVRMGSATADDRERRAVIAVRTQQLVAHVAQLRQLDTSSAEAALHAIEARIRALDVLVQPTPAASGVPEIPMYPEPSDMLAAQAVAAAELVASEDPRGADRMLVISLAVVLYQAIRSLRPRRPGLPEQSFSIGRIASCATKAGVLHRHGLTEEHFIFEAVAQRNRDDRGRYLKYCGIAPGKNKARKSSPHPARTMLVRTDEPIPEEWFALVTDAERDAFRVAFEDYRKPPPTE